MLIETSEKVRNKSIEDRDLSQTTEDMKWFLFGDGTNKITNSEGFEHGLSFVSWTGNGNEFIVSNGINEYRVSIKKEVT